MTRASVFRLALCAFIFGAPLGWLAKDLVPAPAVVPDYPPAVVVVTDEPVPEVRDVVVGELIELEVKGDDVAWGTAPPCDDTAAEGRGGARLFISFRCGGPHAVYAASSLGGKAALTRFDFNVAGGPRPEPGPGPRPVEDDWAARIISWSPGPNPQAVAVAFDEAAAWTQDRLDDSKLVTPQQILAQTTSLVNRAVGNDQAKWRNFFDNLKRYLESSDADGSLTTQRDYVRVWGRIAGALRAV